jgi:hypothetical protein
MLTKLTSEQISAMPEYRDRWIKIGLSTEPAEREVCEQAIRMMYRSAKLAEPRKIVWCGSPLSQGLTRAIILDKKLIKDIGASVRDSVRASVRASVWDSVWDSVGDSVGDSGYGQHDANWLAFYEYFREQCGLQSQTENLTGHFQQARSGGWYLPHQNICWVSECHNLLIRDERGRLHSDTHPALMYPDGWAIYAWHGVRVPARVIEDRSKITVEQILKEQNTEVRRVMRNLYGNDRFMLDAGAHEVDSAPKHGARLLAIQLPGDPVEIRMMELTCSTTGNKYFERVPPDVRSALEGLSWRFRIDPKQYQPLQET